MTGGKIPEQEGRTETAMTLRIITNSRTVKLARDHCKRVPSETKRRRFVLRLGQRGIEPAQLERLVCPIGLSGIDGKEPATIALSLVAQLMILVNDHG